MICVTVGKGHDSVSLFDAEDVVEELDGAFATLTAGIGQELARFPPLSSSAASTDLLPVPELRDCGKESLLSIGLREWLYLPVGGSCPFAVRIF